MTLLAVPAVTEVFFADQSGEERDSATVGVVESVSPGVIEIAVLTEAPHGTALREGTFQSFPRINSYVVIPSERGSILAVVTWVGIVDDRNRSSFESDQIGLATPRRRLRVLPLGTLRQSASLLDGVPPTYDLDRGVLSFPTVGDPVRLPTRAEVHATVPRYSEGNLTFPVGRAPLAADAQVHLDPNRLFGGHLAILGNTGSGKSCTVAHLIRMSASASDSPTAAYRAIILDLNGEYIRSFTDLREGISVQRFSAEHVEGTKRLRVPYWMWNNREWLSFADASAKSQAPQLRRALHLLRTTEYERYPRAVVGLVNGRRIVQLYRDGAIEQKANSDNLSALDNSIVACESILDNAKADQKVALNCLLTELRAVLDIRRGQGDYIWKYGVHQLDQSECAKLEPLFVEAIEKIGVPEFKGNESTIDEPVPFDATLLLDLLPLLAADSGPEVVEWIAPMIERLRTAFADEQLKEMCGWELDDSIENWLKDYLADGQVSQITVLDLSLVPPNILHLVMAVFARVVLEALVRHRRQNVQVQIPIVLVVEEAHALLHQNFRKVDDEQTVSIAQLCREAFERIAREGRKFGLSLVVSSQRPSELSETILSQCNSFLIHRIVNDQDQKLVRRLLPDSLGALTEELPALPTRTALLVGWAVDVPLLIRVADLQEMYRPSSANPDFGAAWQGRTNGNANWGAVGSQWITRVNPDLSLTASVNPGTDENSVVPPIEEEPF